MTNAGSFFVCFFLCINTKSTFGFCFLSRYKQLPQLTTNTGTGRVLGGLQRTVLCMLESDNIMMRSMSCRIFVQKLGTNSPDVAIANDNGGGGFLCICTGGSGTAEGSKGNKTGEELHNYDVIHSFFVDWDWFTAMKDFVCKVEESAGKGQ